MRPGASVLVVTAIAAAATGRAAGVRLSVGASRPHSGRRDAEGTCESLLPDTSGGKPAELVDLDDGSRSESKTDVNFAAHEAEYIYNLSHHRECRQATDRLGALKPLVIPKLKLAFCYVPKVACSQFKDLFNWINKKPNSSLGYGHGYVDSMPYNVGVSRSKITRKNGWKFATFTRDPLLRYISAFGSTCVADQKGWFEHPQECCGPTTYRNVPDGKMVDFVKKRVKQDVKLGTVRNEGHWVQQVEILQNCGWEDFKPESLDYWGQLSGDVNKQVKEMFSMVGYQNQKAIDWFFPKKNKAGHRNPMPGKPHEYVSDYATVEGIMSLYEDDYKMLPGVGCSFTEPLLKRMRDANSSLDLSKARSILGPSAINFEDAHTGH